MKFTSFCDGLLFQKKDVQQPCYIFLMTLICVFANAQYSTELLGEWRDDEVNATVLIYEQDGLFFGKLVDADKPEFQERLQLNEKIAVLDNFKMTSPTEFCCGTVHQLEQGRTINATLVLLDEKTLQINGRYLIFSGTRIWSKL